MKIFIDGHSYKYEVESLVRMFFHGCAVTVEMGVPHGTDDYCYTKLSRQGGVVGLFVQACIGGRTEQASAEVAPHSTELAVMSALDAECERVLGVLLHRVLTPLTGVTLGWGVLTGIRPVKLAHRYHEQGLSDAEIRKIMAEQYLVTPQKITLMVETAQREAAVLALSRPDSYSLYLSIPFCPTRCLYCSFVSHAIEKAQKLVPQYVDLLVQEIEYTAAVVQKLGLRLETIYFGGGTPTTLSAEQLRLVMGAVNTSFDLSHLREYTVEAGRPDTITEDKLLALKECGATRISINPQTMNDSVLEAIGRRHSVQQTVDALALARRMGHSNINMDLIAGLPTDTVEGFCASLEQVLALAPENITLHTLSVKRAAALTTDDCRRQGTAVARMLDYAAGRFQGNAYHPYYLYRQKNTVNNMENVGYCKSGYEGLYNVYIMDETHSIVALGAGGVSKLREPGGGEINRIFNYKYPYEYISRFPEILKRKDAIADFYNRHPVAGQL